MPRRIWTGDRPTHEVELGGGDFVRVYAKMTVHDRAAINEAIVSGHITTETVVGEDGKRDRTVVSLGELRLGATVIATLVRCVQSWRGPGFCAQHDHDAPGAPPYRELPNSAPADGETVVQFPACTPIALTLETIQMMDDSSAASVMEYIEEQNPQPKEGPTATP